MSISNNPDLNIDYSFFKYNVIGNALEEDNFNPVF